MLPGNPTVAVRPLDELPDAPPAPDAADCTVVAVSPALWLPVGPAVTSFRPSEPTGPSFPF